MKYPKPNQACWAYGRLGIYPYKNGIPGDVKAWAKRWMIEGFILAKPPYCIPDIPKKK